VKLSDEIATEAEMESKREIGWTVREIVTASDFMRKHFRGSGEIDHNHYSRLCQMKETAPCSPIRA
jgi:hypothetical protein